MRKTKSLSFSFLAITCFFLLHSQSIIQALEHIATSEYEALGLATEPKRETLEIIIGGGGGGSAPAPSPESSCPPPPPPPCPPTLSRLDRARRVLLKFKSNIYDPTGYTSNWNENTDTCNFHGILCGIFPNTNDRAVAGLDFNQKKFQVPSQLFKKDLDVIFINNNKFSQCLPENFGSTPASIGNANKTLTEVLFLGNKFEGCLPYEIGYLKKATVFDVSQNSLTGPIPASFGCLEKIQFLNLAHNKFYGTVPESVCVLSGIKNNGNLSLAGNYFTKLEPACWSLLKSKILDVSNNCIPGLPNQRSKQECYEFQCKIKPCSNPQSLSYVPCKPHWGNKQNNAPASQEMATEPVTYKSLNPHRLRP
ncbi:putative leucine-rich repeat-containing, plant-type, leucine-rich repeat domain, L [Medicago truncatula]|uniref:Cell wall hydroxyproline-rich glycoprotein n=1 Tax=Medicago truncatula TaxID=3880 RepID=A0A396I973_MEDTR|nr:putative leucine-rich repeat-containing, plant-type, leucine-rich repeat domain, L [Medicago truncatula]